MKEIKQPIFVSGHIKSGTSLMISLLDGHSKLLAFPEELFFFNKLDVLAKKGKIKIADFWDLFFNDIQIKRLFHGEQSGIFGNVDYSHFDGQRFEKECRSAFLKEDLIVQNEKKIFEAIFTSYQKVSDNPADLFWVEKSPTNESNFELWRRWFPESKFIYVQRNPLEVYAAIKKKRQKEGVSYPLTHFINNYKTSLKKAEKLSRDFPLNFLMVDFDRLIHKKEETLKQVVQFLQIDLEEILFRPTKNGVNWRGNSMFRDNNAEGVQTDSLKDLRLSTLTEMEKKVIEDLIIKSNWSFKSNYYFLTNDWKRFLKTQFPILIK